MINKSKILGFIGYGILLVVLVYLVLKITGIVHSAGSEEILLAVVLGQIFYNGYVYRAVHDIEEKLKRIEQKITKYE